MNPALEPLFAPLELGDRTLRNRIVMAPMTRNFSPGGVPTEEVAAYYARRAAHDVGLIISEGVAIAHPSAHAYRDVPVLDPAVALDGWRRVVDEVHSHGGVIYAQLWHVGSIRKLGRPPVPEVPGFGPSAVGHPAYGDHGPVPHAMDERDMDAIVDAYATSARLARQAGFDGVEIHAAHGYLLDQFVWPRTNLRTDRYGIATARGTAFPARVVRAVRDALPKPVPIVYRFSQWKLGAYDEVVWPDEAAHAELLLPLVEAGVDVFHPSTRRLLAPAFRGTNENLAVVTKRITGKPVIAVGSVGLDVDIATTAEGKGTRITPIDTVVEHLRRGEFDLVAIGRALLAEPRWASLVREGELALATPYTKALEATLR